MVQRVGERSFFAPSSVTEAAGKSIPDISDFVKILARTIFDQIRPPKYELKDKLQLVRYVNPNGVKPEKIPQTSDSTPQKIYEVLLSLISVKGNDVPIFRPPKYELQPKKLIPDPLPEEPKADFHGEAEPKSSEKAPPEPRVETPETVENNRIPEGDALPEEPLPELPPGNDLGQLAGIVGVSVLAGAGFAAEKVEIPETVENNRIPEGDVLPREPLPELPQPFFHEILVPEMSGFDPHLDMCEINQDENLLDTGVCPLDEVLVDTTAPLPLIQDTGAHTFAEKLNTVKELGELGLAFGFMFILLFLTRRNPRINYHSYEDIFVPVTEEFLKKHAASGFKDILKKVKQS